MKSLLRKSLIAYFAAGFLFYGYFKDSTFELRMTLPPLKTIYFI